MGWAGDSCHWAFWQADQVGRLGSAAPPPHPSLCQAVWPSNAPPPSLPLRPLHRLVRALTCEIKRDFNYLSAKQQLERITAQTAIPSSTPSSSCQVCLLLFISSHHPDLRESSNSAQAPCAPHLGWEIKDMRWSVLGTGQGVQSAVQGTPPGRSGGASLCGHTLKTASSHLCVCPGIHPSCVGVWLARVNTVCACKHVCNLGQCNSLDEPAVLGKLCCFQQAFTIISCDSEW